MAMTVEYRNDTDITAGCTHLVYGLESGWISPTTKTLQADNSPSGYPLSDDEVAWVASCMSIAATCVVIVHSYISDKYGRKLNIIILAFMGALAWVIRICYNSFACLILARVCAGIAGGGCFNVVLMYIKEISRDDMRGILCTCTTILQCIGIFMMYFIGAYLDYYTVTYIIVCIPIMTMLGMIFAPESPEILIKRGEVNKAKETLAFMRGLDKDDERIHTVVETMMKQAAKFESLPDLSIKSIFKNRTWRRGFVLIMIAFTFFEMNGAFAIVTFASTVLTSTGIEFVISPELLLLSLPIVMLAGSLALASCIERYGRKPLLIGAYVVSCCCMFGIAVIIILQKEVGAVPGWIPVVLMMLIVAMYSGGVCPVTYVMLTEMFSFQIRAKLMSLVVTYGWAVTALVLQIYLPLANNLGVSAPFIFYGFVNLGGVFFTIFYLTETKGKTEEQILQDLMMRKKTHSEINSVE
ncbi:facilitated trehalose transporter Tret1-like [Melitaea cinxia]|uniref:facilitated trehalose transporter Tret1-like n=1 Tax=Melitaea cinxia TaxID=113334 RepID=UPI001E270BB6|nr:facilitated trehalose transporter Tret1-like [Melitaea cinxia]